MNELQPHEMINDEMYAVFKKASIIFIETMKESYKNALETCPDEKSVIIIQQEINNFQRDLSLFMDKIKQHHNGVYTEYDLHDSTLFSAIFRMFKLKSDLINQLTGQIFNNDIRYVYVFDDVSEKSDRERLILSTIENLISKFRTIVF